MIIKKFTAKSENEATEAAKKELGNGIVVMNVKEVKPTGLFAFCKPKQVEVTVAMEEEQEKYSPVRREQPQQPAKPAPVPLREQSQTSVSESAKGIEEKLEKLENLLVNQMQNNAKTEEKPEVNEREEEEASEKVEEKADESGKDAEIVKFIKLLYNTMIDNEVDEKFANQVIEEIDKVYKPNMPMDYILASIYQKLILRFGKADGILPGEKGPRVVLFIGPTGVGKTTTIAKLASRYCVEEKKKVVMLTADTYRIAAAEQLRTYANILQVPFRVIYTAEELAAVIKEYQEVDYIFVDTAGHSHQNTEQLDMMKSMIDGVDAVAEKQVFLVMSATTKYHDLLKIAESYSEMTKYQLIFTKLDETFTLGDLYNVKMQTGQPIAYVTCGQNVPDDIEVFNPQKTVKQLLGGRKQ